MRDSLKNKGGNGPLYLYLLTSVQDTTGRYTFSYDLLDRPLANNAPGHLNGQPITRIYDPNGNRVQLLTGWGTFTALFDARDLLQSLTDPGLPSAGLPGATTTWSYDARMLPVRQDNVNGTSSTLTYDADRRITQVRHSTSTGTEIEHTYLGYDAVHRPLLRQGLAFASTYGYDPVDRLVSEQHSLNGRTTWTYDLAGRRITAQSPTLLTTAVYDAADQM